MEQDQGSAERPRSIAGTATGGATTFQRALPFLVALIPLAIAIAVVPGRTLAADACPPGGEGLLGCQIQKGWAPYVTAVSLVWLGLYVAGQIVFLGGPRLLAHLRAGDRLRRAPRLTGTAGHSDPALAAASWGQAASATEATKVMGGFAWSQAASRAARVTATPELLGAIAPRETHPPLRPAPAAPAPPAPVADVTTAAPAPRPVSLAGGTALHVCGTCLRIVEGDPQAQGLTCAGCGTLVLPQARVRSAAPVPAADAPTRIVLLAGALDARGVQRLEQAIVRRPGEPRRIVVLQLPSGCAVDGAARSAVLRAVASAHADDGEIVLAVTDAQLRGELTALGLTVAPTTTDAMTLAAELDVARPHLSLVPRQVAG